MSGSAVVSSRRSPWPARTRRIRRGLLIGLLIGGGILMMVPFLWMVTTSLKTRAEVFAVSPTLLPANPRWENYADMWNALPFAAFFVNSVKLAVLNTVVQAWLPASIGPADRHLVAEGLLAAGEGLLLQHPPRDDRNRALRFVIERLTAG